MRIEPSKSESVVIFQAEDLDPITLVFRDTAAGKGELLVSCYGWAWSAYWGAMGDQTVRQFVAGCSHSYILNKLTNNQRTQTRREAKYLSKVVSAIKQAINDDGSNP